MPAARACQAVAKRQGSRPLAPERRGSMPRVPRSDDRQQNRGTARAMACVSILHRRCRSPPPRRWIKLETASAKAGPTTLDITGEIWRSFEAARSLRPRARARGGRASSISPQRGVRRGDPDRCSTPRGFQAAGCRMLTLPRARKLRIRVQDVSPGTARTSIGAGAGRAACASMAASAGAVRPEVRRIRFLATGEKTAMSPWPLGDGSAHRLGHHHPGISR